VSSGTHLAAVPLTASKCAAGGMVAWRQCVSPSIIRVQWRRLGMPFQTCGNEYCTCNLLSSVTTADVSCACLQIVATVFAVLWAVRMGSYLVARVWRMRDSRFDNAKRKPFLMWQLWTVQVSNTLWAPVGPDVCHSWRAVRYGSGMPCRALVECRHAGYMEALGGSHHHTV
jgi:hypothetical protein